MFVQQAVLIVCLLGVIQVALCGYEDDYDYQNDFGCDLHVECPPGWAVNAVKGNVYTDPDTNTTDRLWFWNCKKVDYKKDYRRHDRYDHWDSYNKEKCYTHEGLNGPKELLAFRCPKDAYMSGLWAKPLPTEEGFYDREWSVKCCSQPGMCITDCSLSGYLGDYEEDIDYSALPGEYFVGIFSHWNDPNFLYLGRRWKVGHCRFTKCSLKHYLNKYGLEDLYVGEKY